MEIVVIVLGALVLVVMVCASVGKLLGDFIWSMELRKRDRAMKAKRTEVDAVFDAWDKARAAGEPFDIRAELEKVDGHE